MTPRFAIGIGASSKAVAQDVLTLIHECIGAIAPDTILATIDRRMEIASTVATDLGVPFVVFPSSILAQIQGLQTKSILSVTMTGSWSVAEAAALASLGPEAQLVLQRQTGKRCTCALAVLS